MKTYKLRTYVGIASSIIVALFFNAQFGAGMLFMTIMFGVVTKMPRRFDLYKLGVPDFKEDPDEHDGPWSSGWETRCSREALESSFREAKMLALFVDDQVER